MSDNFTTRHDTRSGVEGFHLRPVLQRLVVANDGAHAGDEKPVMLVRRKKPRAPSLAVRHKVSGINRRVRDA